MELDDTGEMTPLPQSDVEHIWLNAFSLIRPTDEFLQSVGKQIVRMLNSRGGDYPREVVIRVTTS